MHTRIIPVLLTTNIDASHQPRHMFVPGVHAETPPGKLVPDVGGMFTHE